MTNPLIAFDESGNTGQDLLNLTQPIFALASVHLSDSETEEAIKILAAYEGKETKFSSLVRSTTGRQRILSLFKEEFKNLQGISLRLK